jgi:hypothetical protein
VLLDGGQAVVCRIPLKNHDALLLVVMPGESIFLSTMVKDVFLTAAQEHPLSLVAKEYLL